MSTLFRKAENGGQGDATKRGGKLHPRTAISCRKRLRVDSDQGRVEWTGREKAFDARVRKKKKEEEVDEEADEIRQRAEWRCVDEGGERS